MNKKLISAQRRVFTYLIKKIGLNLFQGKSIMNVSMPVEIFGPNSFLERLARQFSFAPAILDPAGEINDPIE